MGLKRQLDSLDGLDPKFHAAYVKNPDEEAGGFILDVDDWPDVSGLTRTVRVLRKTEDQYKAFQKALGNKTAEELQAMMTEHETLKNQIALLDDPSKVKDQLEKLTADMKKNYEGTITGLETKLRDTETNLVKAQGDVKRGKIRHGLDAEMRSANVLSQHYDDVYLRADQFDEIDGQLVVINEQGEPLRSRRDATKLKPASEWFEERTKDKPGWFKASESGGPNGGRGSARGQVIDRNDAAAVSANLAAIAKGDVRVQ